MLRIPGLLVPFVVLAGFAIKGLVLLAIAYVGARLAIRHERRISN